MHALPPDVQAAHHALLTSGRVRDAAAAARVSVQQVWAWRHKYLPIREALAVRYARLADKEAESLEAALDRGLASDAEGTDLDRALKAAALVQRGLGIGVMGGDGTCSPARATVAVAVSLDLPGLLRAPSPPALDVPRDARAWLDAPTARVEGNVLDAPSLSAPPPGAVADAQPRRSRASSRRRVVER